MSLSSGARIGPYEVLAKLGAGGMGEVYRARDSKLARDVALKILPEAFAHDAERLARFEREAKTLASLNHPHIAHVYGFEQSGATRALVMELVEGEDLSDRIRRGPIPLDEALPIARQIADALEAAHEAGVVHRDLKPANVKVRDDGTVKVLDFGLAKAFDPGSGIREPGSDHDLSNSPTITSPAMTMRGVILGTAAYMAPEQAKGRFVDKRADIWAFGCVLFEMLTGKRPFEGEDVSDTLASVLRAEPDWAALSSRSTPAMTKIIRRCLVRDPRQRTRDAGDLRLQLDELSAPDAEPQAAPATRSSRMALLLAGVAMIAVVVIAMPLAWRSWGPAGGNLQLLRFSVPLPEGWTMQRIGNGRVNFAISPDGKKLVAALRSTGAGRRLFVRRLDDSEFREVPGTDGAWAPFWAPDSDRLGFSSPAGIRFVSLSGPGTLAAVTLPAYGPVIWDADDHIVAFAGAGRPMYRWIAGEQPAAGPQLAEGVRSVVPFDFLPGGAGVLLVRAAVDASERAVVTVAVERPDGRVQDVMPLDVTMPVMATAFVRSGQLLTARVERSGRSFLTAQPFDARTATLSGQPTVLVSDLNQGISASNNGVLAFAQVKESAEELVWLNERGEVINRVVSDLVAQNMDLSGDDRFVVMQQGETLRLHDLARGVTTNLAVSGVDPIWSADGRSIAYADNAGADNSIFVAPAFGGDPKRVHNSRVPIYIDGWSHDGKWIAAHTNAFNQTDQTGQGYLIPLAPGVQPILFGDPASGRAVDEARFSPDGRLLAFGLNSAEAGDVFLMPLPPTGERWQVSVAGGGQPRWSADGRSLFFLAIDGTLMRVDVEPVSGAAPKISAPRPMFQTGVDVVLGIDQLAVARDGKRFLIRRPQKSVAREEIQLIVNWPALLTKS